MPSLVLENVLNYLNNTKNYSWHHACSLQSENLLSVFAYLTHILHSSFLLMCMLCCLVLMVVKLACRLCWVQRVPLWRVHQLLSSPRQVTRVNSTNVLDEGLRIGEIGCWMNFEGKVSRNRCVSKVNLGVQPGFLSICPTPSPPGPYI
jgi:hypothetical protein